MRTSPTDSLIHHIRRAVQPPCRAGLGDGELLGRFIERRDESAFAALVHRHGPMVWGVCRRLLPRHDAEDAFQAAFLVLARKAASIRSRDAVGNWLYGVAHQTALQARRAAARRRAREVQVTDMPDTPATQPGLPPDLRFVLDEELVRLPDIYRAVVVLCDLEGRSRAEVARLLGVPDGTVGGRLARAREMLAKRLNQRGIVFSGSVAAGLSAGSASASAPPAVVASTIQAASLLAAGQAAGVVSARVAALTEGVVKAMLVSKLKAALSVVLVVAFLATGATLLTYAAAARQEEKKPTAEKAVEPPAKQESKLTAPVPKRGTEKEELTAWGKEIGGLQAGLGYEPGEKRVHRPGETVKLVVRVRNVGKEEVSFQYLRHFFIENPPTVTDDKGKAVAFKDGSPRGIYKPEDVTLAPGKEVELYKLDLALSDKVTDTPQDSTLYGEGKFRLQYERVLGDSSLSSVSIKTDAALRKLATGKLDLVVSRWIHRAAAGQDKEALRKEADCLQGEWAVTSWEEEGQKATADELKGKKLAVKADEISGLQPGLDGRLSFELNPEKTPKEIDLTVLDGKRKGIRELGIYAIERDRLRICFGGTSRPKEFAATPGSGRLLVTLQREPLTAWGKEVGGLQAGLGFRPGEQRAYHPGETVRLVVRVRNVGGKEATASYYKEFFDLNQPAVTDGGGKPVDIKVAAFTGQASPKEITLPPGAEVTLGEISLALRPVSDRAKGKPVWSIFGTGQFYLEYPTIGGSSRVEKGQFDLRNLSTGTLGLEVREAGGPAARPDPAADDGEPLLKSFTLKEADAADLAKVLTPVFKNATITADPRANRLLVRADRKTLDDMAPLIERLDRPAKKP